MRQLFSFVILLFPFVINVANAESFPVSDIKISAKESMPYNYKNKTYMWRSPEITINDPSDKFQKPDFNYDNVITHAIKTELSQLGVVEKKDTTDLIVTYGIDLNMAAIRIKSFAGTDSKLVFNVPEGTLTVHVIDQLSGVVVWSGWANVDAVKRKSAESTQRLNYMVKEIFKRFPAS